MKWYSWICGSRYAGQFFASLDERRKYQYDIDKEEYTQILRCKTNGFKGKRLTEEEISKFEREVRFSYDVRFSIKRKEEHVKLDDETVKMCVANLDKHCKNKYDIKELERKYPVVNIIRKNVFPEFLSRYQNEGKT